MLLPQHRFLLAAATPGAVSREELARLATDLEFRWEDLLALALCNRIASPAWTLLNDDPFVHCVEDEFAEKWRSAHRAVAFLHSVARKQLVELGAVLAAVDIAALLYKGLDFADRYYTHPRFRGFRDLDIIVGKDEVSRTDSALRAAGYRLSDRMPLEYSQRFHLHAEYAHPRWPLPVELHWDLDSPYVATRTDLDAVRCRAIPALDLAPDLMRPSALDALALMAIHLKKHLALPAQLPTREARLAAVIDAGGLVWVLDVTSWMREETAAHGEEEILRRFREFGAHEALTVSLRLAHDLDETALPDWARAAATRDSVETSLVCRLVYPELSSGRPGARVGSWLGRLLLTSVPGLVLRPIRILEAIAPPRASGAGGSRAWRSWIAHLARIARLGAANLVALVRWKLRESR